MSLITVSIFVILLLPTVVVSQTVNINEEFGKWMTENGRTYPDETEKARRFEIFKARYESVESFNKQEEGRSSFRKGINKFSDMTDEEFLAMIFGGNDSSPSYSNSNSSFENSTSFHYPDDSGRDLPDSVDWRQEGRITPVQNQGQCGSCWLFAAVATLEAHLQAWNDELINLSEQQILDCSGILDGCKGGTIQEAFDYVIRNHGLNNESNYIYTGKQGKCDYSKTDQHVGWTWITGYEKVPPNEKDLALSVIWQPIPVVISVGAGFQEYKGGVLRGGCGIISPYHAVLIVGFGITEDYHEEYWIVKNSWGENWGENGYVRMYRGVNLCGIADKAIVPQWGWQGNRGNSRESETMLTTQGTKAP